MWHATTHFHWIRIFIVIKYILWSFFQITVRPCICYTSSPISILFFNSNVWSIVWKAFFKSINTPIVLSLSSIDLVSCSCWSINAWDVVELFLKQYWLFDTVLFIFRNLFNRLLKSFFNIFENCGSKETGLRLVKESFSLDLKIGITFAIFIRSGKIPISIDMLAIWLIGMARKEMNAFLYQRKINAGMIWSMDVLFGLEFTTFSTSFSVTFALHLWFCFELYMLISRGCRCAFWGLRPLNVGWLWNLLKQKNLKQNYPSVSFFYWSTMVGLSGTERLWKLIRSDQDFSARPGNFVYIVFNDWFL